MNRVVKYNKNIKFADISKFKGSRVILTIFQDANLQNI